MSNSLSRRNRRSTGENIQGERTLTQSARRSLPMVNLKEVLVTAKMKFESEQDENSVSSVPVNSEELKRKASSAPASPGKSLTVSVPNPCENVGSTTRSRLLRSESTSPKVKRSSLLMPASEATNYSTDQLQVVDITDSTNLDAQQSALLDETKKAKKIPPKGVSMSEVIRLHQVSSNRFLSYLGCLISFLMVSSCLTVYQIQIGGRSQSALTKFFPSLTIRIVRGLFRTFELRVLTVIDCPKIAGTNSPIFKHSTRAKSATSM